jgi:hypothetical protein
MGADALGRGCHNPYHLASFALPASATLRPVRARVEQDLGFFAAIWHAIVTLLPPLEKLGPGMDPLGNQGTTPPAPTSSGGDLGPGMDPPGLGSAKPVFDSREGARGTLVFCLGVCEVLLL